MTIIAFSGLNPILKDNKVAASLRCLCSEPCNLLNCQCYVIDPQYKLTIGDMEDVAGNVYATGAFDHPNWQATPFGFSAVTGVTWEGGFLAQLRCGFMRVTIEKQFYASEYQVPLGVNLFLHGLETTPPSGVLNLFRWYFVGRRRETFEFRKCNKNGCPEGDGTLLSVDDEIFEHASAYSELENDQTGVVTIFCPVSDNPLP